MQKDNPIGVFDSGVGGVSVLKELVSLMPHENYYYFGDSKNAPYGTKSLELVRTLTCEHVRFLVKEGVKAVVIACNTATSAAIGQLRQDFPSIPIIGIEPAIKPAVLFKPGSTVLVMATPMTLSEKKFQDLLQKYQKEAVVLSLPVPGLVELIEEGETSGIKVEAFLRAILAPYLQRDAEGNPSIDSIVLGCTHYPLIRQSISEVVGLDIPLFDGGWGTACEVKRRLESITLLNDQKERGGIFFKNSCDSAEKNQLCWSLLQSSN